MPFRYLESEGVVGTPPAFPVVEMPDLFPRSWDGLLPFSTPGRAVTAKSIQPTWKEFERPQPVVMLQPAQVWR